MADLSTISGLDHRYRADQITGVSDGGNVSSWPDTSGNAFTATATGTPFTLAASAIGGQPAVRMTPVTGRYLASNGSASLTQHTTVAIFTLHASGMGATRTVIGPSTGNALQRTVNSNNRLELVAASAALIGTGSGGNALAASTVYVATWTWDSSTGAWAIFLNGTQVGSGSTARTMQAATVRLGHSNGSEAFYGDLAEVATWNRVLTASERSTAHSYMQDRYGVTVSDYVASGPVLTSTTAPAVTPTTNVKTGTVLTVTNGAWSAAPDSYTYQWRRNGTAISGATNATYTVVDADATTSVDCLVTAVKSGYTSGSAASNVITPTTASATAPAQVTGLTATAGDKQVTLTWTAPANNGAAITDYLVEYQPSGGSWTTFTRAASTAASATVIGLTNQTAYAFRVSAVNTIGTGTPSATTSATPAAATATIPPNDPNIVYSPYNWALSATLAQCVNAGSYLRLAFKGNPTSIVANFDLTNVDGSGKLAVRIDNEPVTVVDRAATVTITVPNNGWKTHVVEIVVVQLIGNDLWAAPTTTLKFTGFTVAPGSVTTTTTRRRPFNVLCMGDSITNGYLTTSATAIDGRLNWAFPLREYLAAEVGVVGFNSIGFNSVGSAGVPVFSTSFDKIFTGAPRSWTTPAQPDLVLLHVGTNDGGANHVTEMTSVLNTILAATTTTKIVVVQQWTGTGQKAFWQSAITACTAPARVTYLATDGWWSSADSGDGLHPWGYINLTDLTPRLAAAVKPLLTGAATAKRFINVGGSFVAVG